MHVERFFIEDELLIQLRDRPGAPPQELADLGNRLIARIDDFVRQDLGVEGRPVTVPNITGDDVIRIVALSPEELYASKQDARPVVARAEAEAEEEEPIPSVALHFRGIQGAYFPTETTRDAVTHLVTAAKEHLAELMENFDFQYASPNWLFGGTQGTMPTGGPGGRPSPVAVPAQTGKIEPKKFKKQRFDQLLSLFSGVLGAVNIAAQTAQPVNVVILDTAPEKADLDRAYATFKDNDLLSSLRNKLHIMRARQLGIDFTRLKPPPNPAVARQQPTTPTEQAEKEAAIKYFKRSGGYEMPDHGLFIAGIIHQIAPEANIYLVQVLNKYGLGTLDSLRRGLSAIEQNALRDETGNRTVLGNGPLVINMSLCIDFNTIEEVVSHFTSFTYETIKWALSPLLSPLNFLQGLPHDKEDLFAAVKGAKRSRNAIIVAAAGNQADPNLTIPPNACYPAAYDGVIGVGALDKGGQRVWYSNLADTPPMVGVAVLGGDTEQPKAGQVCLRLDSVCPPEESLLGLYSSEFFPNEDGVFDQTDLRLRNETGWAWWSGTSFSTAIMSGIMVNVAERGIPLRDQFLDAGLFISLITLLKGMTPLGEPILEVVQ
ncbi:MAG: S8/S53 family peptidase [Anaerolineae bacterium]|nr:S8/S53 family peptidase [Anaerolineae bacterium]